jgi:hypothetical protein
MLARAVVPAAAVLIGFLVAVGPALAQPDDVENRTKRSRNGGGLRIGVWNVRGLEDPQNGSSSETPAFEGYFQKGLDLHLAWENTLSVWRRSQEFSESGPLGSTASEIQSWVVPTFTALKFYPTRPSAAVGPYASAGVGFVFGVERQDVTGPGLDGQDTALQIGFGFRGGLGIDFNLSRVFGLTLAGRYQWIEFGEELGGERNYEGLGADVGLTYRFQYQ